MTLADVVAGVVLGRADRLRPVRRGRLRRAASGTCSPAGRRGGAASADLIEHSIGPVWEANHVWLIFVLVMLLDRRSRRRSPPIMSTLYIPLTLAALGHHRPRRRLRLPQGQPDAVASSGCSAPRSPPPRWSRRSSSARSPGRSPPAGCRPASPPATSVTSWLNPTSMLGGVLAVGACAYLAAVYLIADADRAGAPALSATVPAAGPGHRRGGRRRGAGRARRARRRRPGPLRRPDAAGRCPAGRPRAARRRASLALVAAAPVPARRAPPRWPWPRCCGPGAWPSTRSCCRPTYRRRCRG